MIVAHRQPSTVYRLYLLSKKNSGANYEKRFKVLLGSHDHLDHRSV